MSWLNALVLKVYRAQLSSRPLKSVSEAAGARQKQPKKRSVRVVHEHFEAVFNDAPAT